MARNIGPKIGIDGEKEYRQQIMNIVQSQKTLNSEMKKTKASFDDDTSAKTKNAKMSEVLSKQVEVQKQRVAALKDYTEKSAKATGDNSTQTLKYKEALADAETELSKLQNELSEYTGAKAFAKEMEEAGHKLNETGEKLQNVGGALTKGLTVPLTGIGAAGIASFKKVDEGMDIVVAKTGATGKELTAMQNSMKSLATQIPTDFADAGAAVGEVNTRFGLTGKKLEELSGQFLKFAQLNETDVSSSIDATQKAMDAFGVSADKAGLVLDCLNEAGQKTGVDVQKLTEDITTNAAALKQMGFSLSDSITFMSQLDTAGIDSSATMMGLKKAIATASKEGKTMPEALSEIQKAMANTKDVTESNRLAIEMFGMRSGPAIAQACRDGVLSFEELSTSLDQAAGNVSATFEETLDPIDQWKLTMNSLQITGAEIGNSLMTVLQPVLIEVSEVAKSVAEKFNNMSDSQKNAIIKIGLFAAATGPLINGLGGVFKSAGTVVEAVGKMPGVFSGVKVAAGVLGSGISSAFTTITAAIGPAGWAIAGVVAGTILIVKNWDKIKAAAIKIKETITNVLNKIKIDSHSAWENIYEHTFGKVVGIKNAVFGNFGNVAKTIKDKMDSAKENVHNAIDSIKKKFNFKFTWPTLKLPHFKASGKFSLKPPSVPSFSVSWYKKAYNNPVMFKSPTVLPTPGGFKGFGDGSGAEIVIGQATLLKSMEAAAGSAFQKAVSSTNVGDITINVFGSENQDVESLVDEIEERINEKINQKERAFA